MTYLIDTGRGGMRMLTNSALAAADFVARRGPCFVKTGEDDIIYISPTDGGSYITIKPLSEQPVDVTDNDVHLFAEIGNGADRKDT